MSARMIEVGRLTTTENNDSREDGVYTYPMAMLITFDTLQELQEAISKREIKFSAWGESNEST